MLWLWIETWAALPCDHRGAWHSAVCPFVPQKSSGSSFVIARRRRGSGGEAEGGQVVGRHCQ